MENQPEQIKPIRTRRSRVEKPKDPRGRKPKPIDDQLRAFINKKTPEDDYLYDAEIIDLGTKVVEHTTIVEQPKLVESIKPIEPVKETPKPIELQEKESSIKHEKIKEPNLKDLVAEAMAEIYKKQREEDAKIREQEKLERQREYQEHTEIVKKLAFREAQAQEEYKSNLRKLKGQLFTK